MTLANADDLSWVRRKMGLLFQSAALFDSFTIFDNLALPLRRFDPDRSGQEIRSIVNDALGQVGLKDDNHKIKFPQNLLVSCRLVGGQMPTGFQFSDGRYHCLRLALKRRVSGALTRLVAPPGIHWHCK